MAEIPIQEKSGSRSWVWLLMLLAIAVIAWELVTNSNDPEPAATGTVGAARHAPTLVAWPHVGHA